jgi:hypothetical protein
VLQSFVFHHEDYTDLPGLPYPSPRRLQGYDFAFFTDPKFPESSRTNSSLLAVGLFPLMAKPRILFYRMRKTVFGCVREPLFGRSRYRENRVRFDHRRSTPKRPLLPKRATRCEHSDLVDFCDAIARY